MLLLDLALVVVPAAAVPEPVVGDGRGELEARLVGKLPDAVGALDAL